MLVAPALWNGYPLLQYDTGGYLARWYEGYLVPSRSTVFGLYLHFGEESYFWINLGIQALATLWILQLTLRVRHDEAMAAGGIKRRLMLILTTALPWLASTLLTDIFAGLSVLSLFILVLHGDKISTVEKVSLFAFTAFAAATHSATLAVLLGLCCAGWIARPFLGGQLPLTGWRSTGREVPPAWRCGLPRREAVNANSDHRRWKSRRVQDRDIERQRRRTAGDVGQRMPQPCQDQHPRRPPAVAEHRLRDQSVASSPRRSIEILPKW